MHARILKTFTAAICLTVLAAGTASAGAVCLNDGVVNYRISKLKLPKKAGDTTSFVGVRYGLNGPGTISGVATKLAAGSTVITVQSQSGSASGNSFELAWTALEGEIGGTAVYDNDGDFVKDDGMATMTVVDCDMVPIQ